jgi:hypothetical protein
MVVCRLASVPSRYPRFVDFSWSFPVNWYIQSILYTPQSSQSHSYLLRFSTSMRNCRLALHSKPFNTHQTLTPSTCLYSLPLPTLHYDYPFSFLFGAIGRPRCRRNTTHLVHAMTCILPPSFLWSKPFISFPRLGELYDSFLLLLTPS